MSRRNRDVGCYYAAFGAGALIALICPIRFILILAVIALILVGISLLRCG